jgi:hypothetical protein
MIGRFRFRPRSEDLQHLRVGPIGPHLENFAALVSQQGYCKAKRLAESSVGRRFEPMASPAPRYTQGLKRGTDHSFSQRSMEARSVSRRGSSNDGPFTPAFASGKDYSHSIAARGLWRYRFNRPGL